MSELNRQNEGRNADWLGSLAQPGAGSGWARDCRCGQWRCGRSGRALLGSEVLPGHFVSYLCGEEDLVSPWSLPSLLCRKLLPVSGGCGACEE